MKKFYLFLAIVALCTSYSFSQAQDTLSNYKIPGGTWQVCVSMTYSDTFQCTKGYTSYEFYTDGTYRENREAVYDGKHVSFVKGKWKLSGNSLDMDENDGKTYKAFPRTYAIVWLDADRFYATGTEGPDGPIVYTFFQRSR